jgi:type I restriction enzyme R subunit
MAGLQRDPIPVAYNSRFPIETFDFIVTDECHRSIYDLWRQVLEYFDASLIGLTATPSKQTLGFFNQNLVMEYNHEQAVADKGQCRFRRLPHPHADQRERLDRQRWLPR